MSKKNLPYGARHKTNFDISASENSTTYGAYLERLTELAISMFEWHNLPDTVDSRFLELTLFTEGQAVFFRDDDLDSVNRTGLATNELNTHGTYLTLPCVVDGPLDVYHIPTRRVAYADNRYRKRLTNSDSVIIYNNMLHTNNVRDVLEFARRLYNLDRIIDVNANAQKTPVLVTGTETQRMTLLNLYKEFDGNAPVIFGDKNLDINALKVLTTEAPYVADKLYQLKTQLWNEALTYLGISNVSYQKKERMVSDEVNRSQGGIIASRYSRLESRRSACAQINRMFGLSVSCDYREDYTDATVPVCEDDVTNESEASSHG